MLMVIFGAGASYDSWSSFPPDRHPRSSLPFRPPLAKELFLPLGDFRGVSELYQRFQPLLPLLEAEENIEQILETFRLRAESDVECRRQLWAIQYYLRRLIEFCQTAWTASTFGVSNYKTFLDQVRHLHGGCFVTFNYDTLLEDAFKSIDIPLATMADYISDFRYTLIKLHGSIDWQYWIPGTATDHPPNDDDLIRAAPVLEKNSVIEKRGEVREPRFGVFLPALAIPTTTKDSFVCPERHVYALRRIIPEVTKIVIVGWRASEMNFLDLVAKGLKDPVRVIAACGNTDAAEATLGRLSAAGIKGDFQPAPGGFTDFVVNRRIEPFLAAL